MTFIVIHVDIRLGPLSLFVFVNSILLVSVFGLPFDVLRPTIRLSVNLSYRNVIGCMNNNRSRTLLGAIYEVFLLHGVEPTPV